MTDSLTHSLSHLKRGTSIPWWSRKLCCCSQEGEGNECVRPSKLASLMYKVFFPSSPFALVWKNLAHLFRIFCVRNGFVGKDVWWGRPNLKNPSLGSCARCDDDQIDQRRYNVDGRWVGDWTCCRKHHHCWLIICPRSIFPGNLNWCL